MGSPLCTLLLSSLAFLPLSLSLSLVSFHPSPALLTTNTAAIPPHVARSQIRASSSSLLSCSCRWFELVRSICTKHSTHPSIQLLVEGVFRSKPLPKVCSCYSPDAAALLCSPSHPFIPFPARAGSVRKEKIKKKSPSLSLSPNNTMHMDEKSYM